jgi:cytochrome c
MLNFPSLLLAACLIAAPLCAAAKFGLGRAALPEEIAAWDVDIFPDGRGLPEGRGNVEDGEEIFAEKCASCHGDFGEGVDNWPVLVGGFDTLADKDPVKTVGSYWPYLSTVWDYIHRSMPFGGAQTLTDDETYALVAYILYANDFVDDDFELSHENFAEVQMYNKDGFIVDDRAETEYAIWRSEPCMTRCKTDVKITMRSSTLNVTPVDEVADGTPMAAADNAQKAPVVEAPPEPEKPKLDPELVSAGEKVFKKCKACHQVGPGAKNRSGPHLNGVVGRVFAGVDGFKYSKAVKSAGEKGRIWSEQELAGFLTKPKKYLKGTKMNFVGLRKEKDRLALIAYLQSVSE